MRLIDADALSEYWKNRIATDVSYITSSEVVQSIKNSPTIDVQDRARWLLEAGYNDRWFCSRCLHITRLHENFCSTCGACMLERGKDGI